MRIPTRTKPSRKPAGLIRKQLKYSTRKDKDEKERKTHVGCRDGPLLFLIMTGPALTENAHRIIFCEHFI